MLCSVVFRARPHGSCYSSSPFSHLSISCLILGHARTARVQDSVARQAAPWEQTHLSIAQTTQSMDNSRGKTAENSNVCSCARAGKNSFLSVRRAKNARLVGLKRSNERHQSTNRWPTDTSFHVSDGLWACSILFVVATTTRETDGDGRGQRTGLDLDTIE